MFIGLIGQGLGGRGLTMPSDMVCRFCESHNVSVVYIRDGSFRDDLTICADCGKVSHKRVDTRGDDGPSPSQPVKLTAGGAIPQRRWWR